MIWLALLVFLLGLAAGATYAVLRGLALWRRFKAANSGFGTELDRIAQATAQIEEQLARADESSAHLAEAAERLRVSKARLEIQLAAAREARQSVRRMLWFLPGT